MLIDLPDDLVGSYTWLTYDFISFYPFTPTTYTKVIFIDTVSIILMINDDDNSDSDNNDDYSDDDCD